MVVVESADGKKKNVSCIGCALQKGVIKTLGDKVYEGKHFEVRQDYEIPIPGFFVIASKRHIVGFADFNEGEKKEFIDLLSKLRKGMKSILKVKYVEVLFREDTIVSKTNPSHFHLALLPIYGWMDKFSGVLKTLEHARKKMKTKANLKKVREAVEGVKKFLS